MKLPATILLERLYDVLNVRGLVNEWPIYAGGRDVLRNHQLPAHLHAAHNKGIRTFIIRAKDKHMKKQAAIFCSMIGASTLLVQHANAANYGAYYEDASSNSGQLTLTLSGDCSAKITVPITYFAYLLSYADNTKPGIVDTTSDLEAHLFLATADGDITLIPFSNFLDSQGQKFSDQVKKGKRSINITTVNNSEYNLPDLVGLSSGSYDHLIKCKDGGTLDSQMKPGWSPTFDHSGSLKSTASVVHTNTISDPDNGSYKAKYSISGYLSVPGQCKQTGLVNTDNYSLVCMPSKKIKLSFQAKLVGKSVQL